MAYLPKFLSLKLDICMVSRSSSAPWPHLGSYPGTRGPKGKEWMFLAIDSGVPIPVKKALVQMSQKGHRLWEKSSKHRMAAGDVRLPKTCGMNC